MDERDDTASSEGGGGGFLLNRGVSGSGTRSHVVGANCTRQARLKPTFIRSFQLFETVPLSSSRVKRVHRLGTTPLPAVEYL